MTEASDIRLPQRFQWKDEHEKPWRNGVVLPSEDSKVGEWWTIIAGDGFGSFDDDPWETMGHVLGDVPAFRWIDDDYNWHPRGAICCNTEYETAEEFREHLKACHRGG